VEFQGQRSRGQSMYQVWSNPLKDVDSRVFTNMFCGINVTPCPLTLKLNRVPDSPKDYVCQVWSKSIEGC
jgi:predicted metal-binding transcription factor (methanogenesis marker protein 9)